jgi:hypothetical protein
MRSKIILAVGAVLLAGQAMAQPILSYNAGSSTALWDFELPWSGPGAALFNPARLTESRYGSALFSRYQTASGKFPVNLIQGGANAPLGFAAGFAYSWNGSRIDNSVAYFQEATTFPMLAWRLPMLVSGWRLDVGAGLPIYYFNAFNAVRSSDFSLDLGALGTLQTPSSSGRLQFGLAAHDLLPVRFNLPEPAENFRARYPRFDFSSEWTSPRETWDLFLVMGLEETPPESLGGPKRDNFSKGYGVEFRPLPCLGLKWEVTRYGLSQPVGLRLHLKPLIGQEIDFEGNVYHAKFLHPPLPDSWVGEKRDEGLGYIVSFSLGAAI